MNYLESIIELAQLLSQLDSFDEMLRLSTRKVSQMLQADNVLIMMLNPQTHDTVKTVMHEGEKEQEREYRLLHTNLIGWTLKNKSSFLSCDLKSDGRFSQRVFGNSPFASAICVPFRLEGIITGCLVLFNRTGSRSFDAEDLQIAERLAAVISPYIGNARGIQEYFNCAIPDSDLMKKYGELGLLGRSASFLELLKSIDAASKCSVRVFIEGESGTGKELIARAIHRTSARGMEKFVVVDCSAIPANLIEDELFGHVKGAFTGAVAGRRGLIAEADGGTLFIDEVNSLPLDLQAKLLRVIQEGEYRPVGSNDLQKSDVRIISASNVSVMQLVKEKRFREDLYYRLNVYPVYVPPLDKRREDISWLAANFVVRYAKEQGKEAEVFDNELSMFVIQRKWNGNVRELENFVERMVTLAPAECKVIELKLLPQEYKKEYEKLKSTMTQTDTTKPLSESLSEYEEQLIRMALVRNSWNQTRAAASLKIPEQTLRYKMNKLNIHRSSEL